MKQGNIVSDRTGHKLGTLDPVLYFENANGHIILPPAEIGQGPALARQIYETRYKKQGYEWREAGTLNDVDRLQQRLVAQESAVRAAQGERMDAVREKVRRETSSNLRTRMQSAGCSAYEREFIQLWLDMDEQKRQKFTQRWTERVEYIWAREQDSKTRVEDRMGSE